MADPILRPVMDEMGNVLYWEEYRDPGLLPDGTYEQPRNPDYGTVPDADPYLGAPPNSVWNGQSGNWATVEPKPMPDDTSVATPPPAPPPGPGPTTNTTNTGGGGMSSLSIPPPNNENFVWPEFDAPEFKAPDPFSYAEYDAPQPFAYDDFQVPTADQARMDPGYEFGRTEGLRALTNRASASGSARTGGTMKDLIKWGNSYADQNYGNVFNRNLQTYSTNRDNAFDTWGANELARARTYDTNRNNAADAYATNYGVTRDTFDRNYTSALDEFKPKQQAARDTFDDLYRRWQAELNATAGVAGFGAA